MSYEPTIIISKLDLHKYADQIDAFTWQKVPAKLSEKAKIEREAYFELKEALMLEGFIIRGIQLILIKPEITAHNAAVRKILHEFNIEFAVDN